MQAASITCIQLAPNSAEPSAEAASSSQAQKTNAASPSQSANTRFTAILQKGIADDAPNAALGLEEAASLDAGLDSAAQASAEASVDVCGLLMQLMVMNATVQTDGVNNGGSAESETQTMQGILGVINENPESSTDAVRKGLDHALSVILQNDGKAAEVLRALASSRNAAAGNDGQPISETAAAQLDAALAGIAEALNKELKQNDAALDAQPAGDTVAVSVIENDNAPGAAFLLGKNDKSDASVNSDKARTTDRTAGLFRAGSTAAADETEKNAAAVVSSAGDSDESSFAGSRDSGNNGDVRMAANGANPVLSQAGTDGEVTAEKTAAVERALTSFTDDLTRFQGGSKEIRIVLEPEELGVLLISVVKTESGISAKIRSEDKEVAAIISGQLQKLISSMESRGLTVDNVDVAYSQLGQNTSFDQQNFSQARDEASKGYTGPSVESAEGDTPTAGFWQSYQGAASSDDTAVDYRI